MVSMATERLDKEACETAVRLGKIDRDKTGLGCENLADVVWGAYQELKSGDSGAAGAMNLVQQAMEEADPGGSDRDARVAPPHQGR